MPFAQRVANEVRAVLGVQLRHDVRLVRLDRLHADHEVVGDLLIGAPFGNELQHLALSAGERVDARLLVGPFGLVADLREVEALADRARVVAVPAVDRLDGQHELRDV